MLDQIFKPRPIRSKSQVAQPGQWIRVPARKIFSALTIAIVGVAHGTPPCDLHSKTVGSFEQAVERINQLPEFRAWKSGHTFPVAYGMGPDKQDLISGKCYWDVHVFADRPERLEHWQDFYVSAHSKTIFIFDPIRGEPITIAKWRDQERLDHARSAP